MYERNVYERAKPEADATRCAASHGRLCNTLDTYYVVQLAQPEFMDMISSANTIDSAVEDTRHNS